MKTWKHCILIAIVAILFFGAGCKSESPSSGDTVININRIEGITVPVTGETPVTTITSTSQYTGTVTWSGKPSTFANNMVYTATITLTVISGYTLEGLAANFFVVDGATTTTYQPSSDSRIVTAVFPATGVVDGTFLISNTDDWNNALQTISVYDKDNDYILNINGDIAVPGSGGSPSFGNVTGVSITLKGSGKLSLNSPGNLIRLANYQTLIIDSNDLILERSASNNDSGAIVYATGANTKVDLRNGTITGNRKGGGFDITFGSFVMSGGTISNNINVRGGGVNVFTGSFSMSGGIINGNTAEYNGGGVYIVNGTFTMTGGEISENIITENSSFENNGNGGGVAINSAQGSRGVFNMSGGTISGNTAKYSGGGVGVIEGNFDMYGGTIKNNTATTNGGGVHVVAGSFFQKRPEAEQGFNCGIIYGYDENDAENSNVVKNASNVIQTDKGHAVYVSNTLKREKTVILTEMLNSTGLGSWTEP